MIVALIAPAQVDDIYGDPQLQPKTKKQVEKAIQTLTDSVDFLRAEMAMERGHFVMLFSNVKMDAMAPVRFDISDNTNFIVVQEDFGILQFTFPGLYSGPNGLGGFTVKGRLGNVKMEHGKNGDVHYSFVIRDSGMSAQVFITLHKSGNYASAFINPTFGSMQTTAHGRILPYRNDKLPR